MVRYKAKGVVVSYPDNPIPGKDRELIPRDATVRILAEKLGSIGISLPVTESDFEKIRSSFPVRKPRGQMPQHAGMNMTRGIWKMFPTDSMISSLKRGTT